MTPKSYSQKVARVFEIVDYLMLLPAGVGAMFGAMLIRLNPLYTLLVYAFLITGIVLFIGYYKHVRGRLDARYFSALWATTAVYNLILLLPTLYLAALMLQGDYLTSETGKPEPFMIILFLIVGGAVFGYLAAVGFSVNAYFFEKSVGNNSRPQSIIINP